MAFDVLQYATTTGPLRPGDTVTLSYPAGATAADYAATGHTANIFQTSYEIAPTFGASVTFLWPGPNVPAHRAISIELERGADTSDLADAAGTRAAWAALSAIPRNFRFSGIRTTGYATVGDGGGALYKYVASQPSHSGYFADPSGGYWELAESEIDPRMLGAKGDGTTDDTIALRNCALMSASRVRVRAGTYITQVVTLATAGQDWVIDGTLKLKSGSNSSALSITATDVTVSGGGVIDGNRTNQTRGQYVGAVHAVTADGVRVDGSGGLTIQNTAGPGVYFIDCNRCSVINTRIVTTDLMAIFVGTSNGTSITDVEVCGNRVDRSADTTGLTQCGILVQYNPSGAITDFRVRGNRVLMPTTSLVFGNVSIAIRATKGVCDGNQTRGGYMGLSIDTATDVSVCGNSCVAFTGYGIELPGSSRCSVMGNTLVGPGYGTAAWGIIIDGPSTSPTANAISGNVISSVDYGAGSSGVTAAPRNTFTANNILFGIAGIYLTNADEAQISGNILKGNAGTGDCVFLNKSDKANVNGNTMRTAATMVNMYDATATTQTHTLINDNMREGVTNLFAFSGSRTAGTSCTCRNNSSGFNYIDIASNIVEVTAGENPSGSRSAGIGSRWFNTFGGAGTTYFVKESGTGTAGWVGK